MYFNIYFVNIIRFKDWKYESANTEYYQCNDCNSIYPYFGSKMEKCIYCYSKDVRLLSEDEYFSELEERIDDPKEMSNILKNKEEMKLLYIDPNSLTYPNLHTGPSIASDREHFNKINNG